MRILFLIFTTFITYQAQGALRASVDGVAWQNSFTNPNPGSNTGAQTLGKLSVSGRLDKKNKLWAGWQFLSFSSVVKVDSESSTLATLDMGPVFSFDFGREKFYSTSFFYGLKNVTTFNDGSSSRTLTGTSMNFNFSVNPMITDNLSFSAGLNYYLGSYTISTVSGTQTNISYTFTNLIPTLGMRFIW